MSVAIFVGPSLPREEVIEILPDAMVLPPAEQGDIEFAYRNGARVIGLIDGVHTNRLPVWHKEILHVLSKGGRVIGAASMGALRAVECEPWGAEPIGEVASWYNDGLIEADDEVCIAHLGRKHKWRPTSLPLVNIRASLRAAQVGSGRQAEIISAAQGIFYANRVWRTVFDAAECSSTEQEQILACELDIKAADAMHLLFYISNLPPRGENAIQVTNSDKFYGGVFLSNDRKIFTGKKVVRQHQLAAPAFRDAALNRALALEFCKLAGISDVAPEVPFAGADDLDEAGFKRLRDEEATLAKAREWYSNAASGFEDVPKILDFLRVVGAYGKAKEVS